MSAVDTPSAPEGRQHEQVFHVRSVDARFGGRPAFEDFEQTRPHGNAVGVAQSRAADVGVAVLQSLTPELRKNIVERGEQLVAGLRKLAEELGGAIVGVQGTGLLCSAELDPRFSCCGAGSTEEYLRQHGLGVIHGGTNSLRYTPGFNISEEEVKLVLERTRDALMNGPGSS